jgi:hypothetical protein
MDKTFGFDTAVEAAQRAINSAYIEVNHLKLSNINIWENIATYAHSIATKNETIG